MNQILTKLIDAIDPYVGRPRWHRRELARLTSERETLALARIQLIEQIQHLAASHHQLADNHQELVNRHQELADRHQELVNRYQELADCHQELAGRHQELADCHQELAGRHQELAGRHQELAGRHQELADCHQELAGRHQELVKDRYRLIDRYLVLLQDCLTGSIYEDPPLRTLGQETFDPVLRQYGWDWPSRAHTMIGRARLANVRTLAEKVLWEGVPGDFIETGVWRGGACILMRGVLEAFGIKDRRVWLADSFEGLPPPDVGRFPADANGTFHTFPELAVGLEEVKRNFEKYGLLDDQVRFLKGWFRDTLPTAPIERLALLRLDGDMYESTIIALESLYGKLSPGGFVIIDDYHVVEGCRLAVHDFMTVSAIAVDLHEIDGVGVYWRKPGTVESP